MNIERFQKWYAEGDSIDELALEKNEKTHLISSENWSVIEEYIKSAKVALQPATAELLAQITGHPSILGTEEWKYIFDRLIEFRRGGGEELTRSISYMPNVAMVARSFGPQEMVSKYLDGHDLGSHTEHFKAILGKVDWDVSGARGADAVPYKWLRYAVLAKFMAPKSDMLRKAEGDWEKLFINLEEHCNRKVGIDYVDAWSIAQLAILKPEFRSQISPSTIARTKEKADEAASASDAMGMLHYTNCYGILTAHKVEIDHLGRLQVQYEAEPEKEVLPERRKF